MTAKRKRQRTRPKSTHPTPSPQKIKAILRDLPSNLSFHFYEEIGRPIGQVATNLLDLNHIFASAQSQGAHASLMFHMRRGDFATWIREAVGDSELANKIAKIQPDDRRLQRKLHKTVDDRIQKLKESLIKHSIVPEDHPAMMHLEQMH